ncbi:MAG: efflux RND transporter periplasmic adaptor subunit [Flavobacteriaceae bacterium]|nr:efflux RND transporter periplasmic adaptor subunit [Flavobacteriaceae bacterium]
MKNNIKILILTIIFFSCENSIDKKSGNQTLETLFIEKEKKSKEIEKIKKELNLINNKIQKKTNLNNLSIISSLKVVEEKFDHFVEFQGNIKTKKNIIIYPEISGILEKIYVSRGDYVKKGELLVETNNEILKLQLEKLKLESNLLKTSFERNERLWNKKIGSEMEFLQSKTKYLASKKSVKEMLERINKTKIYAKFSGYIDDIITNEGSNLNQGLTPILRLVNIDQVFVEVEVPEKHIPKIKKGTEVIINFPILNKSIKSKIFQVGNHINPSNRSFKIQINLSNIDQSLKPNMTCKIKVNDYSNDLAIMIPIKNVLENSKGKSYVYKVIKDSNLYKTKKSFISLGKSYKNKIEVTNGIKVNDQIVNEGLRLIKDNQYVNIINIPGN